MQAVSKSIISLTVNHPSFDINQTKKTVNALNDYIRIHTRICFTLDVRPTQATVLSCRGPGRENTTDNHSRRYYPPPKAPSAKKHRTCTVAILRLVNFSLLRWAVIHHT